MRINLDTISNTAPSQASIQALLPYYELMWGSNTSPHALGNELFSEIEKSYKAIYELGQISQDDVFVFTSSGAEAISQVVYSVYKEVARKQGKNHFVTSCVGEAPSILSISRLEDEGCSLRMAQVTKAGVVTKDTLADCITPRTALVSISWACALTGVIQPVDEIAKLCKQRGILLHIDITHVLGKIFLDLEHIGWDYLTFNGSQLHAPLGTGGLFAKKASPLLPLISGEKDLEQKRGGSIDVAHLAALGQAACEMKQNEHLYSLEVARLRNQFEEKVEALCPEAKVLFKGQERLPQCSCIVFPGVKNEALLYLLNRKNLYASMGGGVFQQIELVLSSMQVDPLDAKCAITFSLSKNTTEDEIDTASRIIQEAYNKLRKLSKGLI